MRCRLAVFDQYISYHCPIYGVFNFDKLITHVYSRKIFLYDRGIYGKFSNDLEITDWKSLKH